MIVVLVMVIIVTLLYVGMAMIYFSPFFFLLEQRVYIAGQYWREDEGSAGNNRYRATVIVCDELSVAIVPSQHNAFTSAAGLTQALWRKCVKACLFGGGLILFFLEGSSVEAYGPLKLCILHGIVLKHLALLSNHKWLVLWSWVACFL